MEKNQVSKVLLRPEAKHSGKPTNSEIYDELF